jgi:hypothetical protein
LRLPRAALPSRQTAPQRADSEEDRAVAYKTHVGSLDAYDKGTIELADDLRKYAFSNIYEVAGKAAPFERVAVVQNLEYVPKRCASKANRRGTPRRTTSSRS